MTIAFWSSRRADQPGGTTVVVSNSSTSAGPTTGVRRSARPTTGHVSRPAAARARSTGSTGGRVVGRDQPATSDPRRGSAARDAHVDELDLVGLGRVAVRLAGGSHGTRRAGRPTSVSGAPAALDRDRQVVALAGVADVGAPRRSRHRATPRLGELAAQGRPRASRKPRREIVAGRARAATSKTDRLRCHVSSASSRPSAEKTPAAAGIRTWRMPSDSASAAAKIGPLPPNARSAKSRGSRPR